MKQKNKSENVKTTILDILKEAGISSEMEALKNQAWMISLAKIQKYQNEINQFQKKHQTDFEEFENKLSNQKNSENFETEDDYLDWKFAWEALKIWKARKDILEHA